MVLLAVPAGKRASSADLLEAFGEDDASGGFD
jgi:hypothetical protein